MPAESKQTVRLIAVCIGCGVFLTVPVLFAQGKDPAALPAGSGQPQGDFSLATTGAFGSADATPASPVASASAASVTSPREWPGAASYFQGIGDPIPVPAGARVTVGFDEPEYFIGENVPVHIVLENRGKEPFNALGGIGSQTRITATDESGHLTDDSDPNWFNGGGRIGGITLNPGEKSGGTVLLSTYRNITKPGSYLIHVYQSFGWTEDVLKNPAGEARITLRMPNPAQAEAIVSDLESLQSVTESRFKLSRDITSCNVPVYVDPLMRRAKTGDLVAVQGLGAICAPEATAALLKLATISEGRLAIEAAQQLVRRLPGRGPPYYGAAGLSYNELVSHAWDEKLRPDVRKLAVAWLARIDPEFIASGVEMLQSVGTASDADAIIAKMDRLIPTLVMPRDRFEYQDWYPLPLGQLLQAVQKLRAQGYAVDENGLHGSGEIMVYFSSFQTKQRSDRWLELVKVYARDPSVVMREAAIRSIPYPAPPSCAQLLTEAMADPDVGVSRAALFVSEHKTVVTPFAGLPHRKDMEMPDQVFNVPPDAGAPATSARN